MYIHRVFIENVKAFREGQTKVDLCLQRPDGRYAGWTVLAGRNGSGKTTFLRCLAMAIAGPSTARSLHESFAGWITTGLNTARVSTQLTYDPKVDRFERTGRLPASTFATGLEWRRSSDQEPVLSEWVIAKTMKQTPERGPWGEDPKGWFVAGYGPFRRLTGHASDAQRLMVGPNHISRLVSLFREDASLLECVQWLKDVYLRRLEDKPGAADLEAVTIGLLNQGMLPDGMAIERVNSDGLWVNQHGSVLALRDLSDGYRTAIALVLDILRNLHKTYDGLKTQDVDDGIAITNPGVILIDEMDVHLHVSWQQRIGFWLKKYFPNIQFIVSSHSPFVCQAADPGGLIRLPAPGDYEPARAVSSEIHQRIVRGTADDAVLSELFGLESSRSPETKKLMDELAALELKRLQGAASARERARLQELQLELPLTPSVEVERSLAAMEAAASE